MIIEEARNVRASDPATFAWSGLRRFHNVDFVAGQMAQLHKVPDRWRKHVHKQATQLRYCLTQAREYFSAAASVSLATKPNLLYYGTMSLALAEILFKQSGDSSLDRARDEHNHHGLSMSAGNVPDGSDLATTAQALRARPIEIDGKRRGTFELWHRTCREHPLAGLATLHYPNVAQPSTRFQVILGAEDAAFPSMPLSGITLADCFVGNPWMAEHLIEAGIRPAFARGTATVTVHYGEQWRATSLVTFHPGFHNETIFENTKAHASMVDRIDIIGDPETGMHLRFNSDYMFGDATPNFLPAATMDTEEWRMWVDKPCLNEFGYFYTALHIAGNYARYFPDRWLNDIERSTPLALAIEELCRIAEWRAPWLTLCELARILYVNEA